MGGRKAAAHQNKPRLAGKGRKLLVLLEGLPTHGTHHPTAPMWPSHAPRLPRDLDTHLALRIACDLHTCPTPRSHMTWVSASQHHKAQKGGLAGTISS